MRSPCDMLRELVCGPFDVSDWYRGNDPVPDWIAELGRPPGEGPRGSVATGAHLERIFAARDVVPRQYQLTWNFPSSDPVPFTEIDDDSAKREIQLAANQEFIVSAYRWAFTGAPISGFPGPPSPPLPALVSQLYTPVFVHYGTDDDKVTDRPQNIVCTWGSRRAWAYPPRTRMYRAGRTLEFRAAIDWRLMEGPDGPGDPAPPTRLDIVIEGLDLYPRSAR